MLTAMAKNGLILSLFAVVTTGLISLTFFGTKDQIALQQQKKLLRTLNAVIDTKIYDNAIAQDCALLIAPDYLGSEQAQRIYRATWRGKPVAAAIESIAPDGYSGKIRLIVGVGRHNTNTAQVLGVRILEHKETPGLGDKIDLRISDWVLDFDNQSLQLSSTDNWAVKKDGGQFDQFTGATITPRAVVKAIKNSVEYYITNQSVIFAAANACGPQLKLANPSDLNE
jgi:electron transport complex protein RnfG